MINLYPIPFAGPIPKLELNCSPQRVSCWLKSWSIHRRGLIGFFEQMTWTDPPLLMVAAAHSQHFLGAEEGQSASKGSLIHKVLINVCYLIIIIMRDMWKLADQSWLLFPFVSGVGKQNDVVQSGHHLWTKSLTQTEEPREGVYSPELRPGRGEHGRHQRGPEDDQHPAHTIYGGWRISALKTGRNKIKEMKKTKHVYVNPPPPHALREWFHYHLIKHLN